LSAAITELFYTATFDLNILLPLGDPPIPTYDKPTAKVKKFELENPAPILDEEDEETLATIDEGIRDAEAGRVGKTASSCPSELPSPSRKKR
jgi:hypothetical protein